MLGRARRAVGILAVVVVISGVVTGPAVAARTPLPRWQVVSTLALGTDHASVDCPTATVCWALESGHLLSSADAGQTWSDRTALVPSEVSALVDVSCTAADQCAVAATDASTDALVLFLAGTAMTVRSIPAASAPLTSLSCTSAQRCVGVVAGTSFATSDGGATWTQGSLLRTLLGEPNVDCVARTTVCYAVGNYGLVPVLLRSADRGLHWTMQNAPWDDGGVYGLDCASATECVATGASYSDYALVVRTVDAGEHWTFASVPSHPYPLRSVSCVTATRCTAIGQSPGNTPFVLATTDGQNWSSQSIPAIGTEVAGAISCPTATTCAAVAGAQGFATTDAGVSWDAIDVPAAVEAPGILACATTTRCVGGGTDAAGRPFVLGSGDGGATWTPADIPAGPARPTAIECPAVRTCFALAVVPVAGTSRNVTQFWASADAGQTWTVRGTRTAELHGLSCPDASTCLLSGYDHRYRAVLQRTTDAGASFASLTLPTTDEVVGAVCGSVDSCVVLAGRYDGAWNSYTSTDLGTSFTAHHITSQDWFGLDCSGSFCMAVGADSGNGAIATSTDGGVSWTDATVPREAQLISDVSCGNDNSCAASTYDFSYYTGGARIIGTRDAGATWTVFKVPARREAPIAVACAQARCIGSDYSRTGNPIVVAGPS